MNAAVLTPEQAEALQRLASSPAARQAAEQHEQGRAEQRRSVLERLAADEATARTAQAAAGAAEQACRVEVEKLQVALRGAVARLRDAARRETELTAAREAVVSRARRELAPLGGSAIDDALTAVRWAGRTAASAISFRVRPDWYGGEKAPQIVDDTLPARAAQMAALGVELEGLRLADMAPAAIEARCSEIRTTVESGEVPTPANAKPPPPGVLARLLAR
jgi:hypothetical protein